MFGRIEKSLVILSDSERSYTLANLAAWIHLTYQFYKIFRYRSRWQTPDFQSG